MMKSTQSFGSFSEEHSEDKNKGKEEDSCGKGGQFPTKPCINPCNFSFDDNAKVFSHESFIVPGYLDEVSRSHPRDERSMNAITSLRSGKILPNIVLPKESKIDIK